MYDNINFMLSRPRDFEKEGRAQDEVMSVKIDLEILNQFSRLNIPYTQIESPDHATVAYEELMRIYAH
jgi:hypothetical protein